MADKEKGMVIVENKYDAFGRVEQRTYTYEGGDLMEFTESFFAHAVPSEVWFSRWPLQSGDKFEVGPFRFRMLEQDRHFHFDRIIAVRDRGLITDLRYFWHKVGRRADLAYRRLIITLSVWRLAERTEGKIPSWNDVYILRRLAAILATCCELQRFLAEAWRDLPRSVALCNAWERFWADHGEDRGLS